MKNNRMKKGILSLALALSFAALFGTADNAMAQGRRWDNDRRDERIERIQEREALERVRRLDRNRQVRYQNRGGNRVVGYFDRFGRFQAVGFYDRFGRFHRS